MSKAGSGAPVPQATPRPGHPPPEGPRARDLQGPRIDNVPLSKAAFPSVDFTHILMRL